MKRFVVFCVTFLQSFSFLLLTVCALAQDQQKENSQPIPKPQEIGQFFSIKDGKLTPLNEEKDV